MKNLKKYKAIVFLTIVQLVTITVIAQQPLQKTISIQVAKQKLGTVLEIMSNTGNFYFSYNSTIIKKDSLVNLSFVNKPVSNILDYLFDANYQFIESGNYIIIRRKPIAFNTLPQKVTPTEENIYYVTGFIVDEATGANMANASIYEPDLLLSDVTNKDGYFKIKIKSKYTKIKFRVSKNNYRDTTVQIIPNANQQINIVLSPENKNLNMITIKPNGVLLADTLVITTPNGFSSTYIKLPNKFSNKSRVELFFISSKLKIQSLNIKGFLTTRNFQISFVPGIGTQGKLSAQVQNNYSFNILGGYTGTIKKIELAGLFNINKNNVQYIQAAGIFNTVGGSVKGVQLAGINNLVLDSVKGFQAAGINNYVRGKFKGVQAAGIYNHVTDTIKGVQLAGIANFSKKNSRGTQVAGILNYAKKIKGVQVGLINIADTLDGYSIGLININKNGYHKLSLTTNETIAFNASYKSGNAKLYSIITIGLNLSKNQKLFSFGYGIGKESKLNKHVLLSTELTAQNLYAGSWDYYNMQTKLALHLQFKIKKKISVFAGPSFSVLHSDQNVAVTGYQYPLPSNNYHTYNIGKQKGWIGFTAGVNLF
jgi:hypothetical protein